MFGVRQRPLPARREYARQGDLLALAYWLSLATLTLHLLQSPLVVLHGLSSTLSFHLHVFAAFLLWSAAFLDASFLLHAGVSAESPARSAGLPPSGVFVLLTSVRINGQVWQVACSFRRGPCSLGELSSDRCAFATSH